MLKTSNILAAAVLALAVPVAADVAGAPRPAGGKPATSQPADAGQSNAKESDADQPDAGQPSTQQPIAGRSNAATPGQATTQRADAATQPGDAVTQPGDAVTQPGDAVTQPGDAVTQPAALNTLTAAEKADGWTLLFNGRDLAGWRGFREKAAPDAWQAVDGAITRTGDAPDLITDQKFGDFELSLQWKVPTGGNSGIIYRVSEDQAATYLSGPEMQVLDDAHHPDGKDKKTSAGSCYALYGPTESVVRPACEWNTARLLVHGNHVEHWLNGKKVVVYELHSDDWKKHLAASKFAHVDSYGQAKEGYIALQSHGEAVEFRDIKLREIRQR